VHWNRPGNTESLHTVKGILLVKYLLQFCIWAFVYTILMCQKNRNNHQCIFITGNLMWETGCTNDEKAEKLNRGR
jgi:hypothetical protein